MIPKWLRQKSLDPKILSERYVDLDQKNVWVQQILDSGYG